MADLSIQQKKEWAKQLYIENRLTQKLIAEKVGVSEKTLSRWVNDPAENWDRLRKSLLISKQEVLSGLYEQLDEIKKKVQQREPGQRYPDSKEADIIMKLTASIEKIEEETNLADVFEVGKRFITFLQQHDLAAAKQVVDYYDAFIKHCLKSN
jgi:transcriptional regulator with XRE-family HTH domain